MCSKDPVALELLVPHIKLAEENKHNTIPHGSWSPFQQQMILHQSHARRHGQVTASLTRQGMHTQ